MPNVVELKQVFVNGILHYEVNVNGKKVAPNTGSDKSDKFLKDLNRILQLALDIAEMDSQTSKVKFLFT